MVSHRVGDMADRVVSCILLTWKFVSFQQNMSTLVERVRLRTDRKPIYNTDESDDDADLMPIKHQTTQEKFERIVRSDVVSYILPFCSYRFCVVHFILCCTLPKFCLHFWYYSVAWTALIVGAFIALLQETHIRILSQTEHVLDEF